MSISSVIDKYIEIEVNNIKNKYWRKYINNEYVKLIKSKYYRTRLQDIPNIEKIKLNVYDKLGSIAPYIFLTNFCNKIKIPGAYNEIEKGLLLLEFLLNGFSFHQMEIYIHETNFYRIYQSIFIDKDNKKILNEWLDDMLYNCFSTNVLRLLSSKKMNPSLFDHVTLFLDGHHSKIAYQDINLEKTDLYSYKLKTNGLNTQFIIDCNNICVHMSNSLPCKNNTDDNMFLNIKLNKFFKNGDCICFDGLYQNTVDEIIEKYNNVGFDISINNFTFPIRKDKGIKLTLDEENYNSQLGSFRSKIETYFATLGKIFKRFDAQQKIRITDNELYNLQLKLACVLLNIKTFSELFSMEDNNNLFNKWREEGFDYFRPNEISLSLFNNKISNKTQYRLQNIQNIKSYQNTLLQNTISTLQNIDIMEEDDNITINNYNKYKQKEKTYEIQYIIKHRGSVENREFYVKWKKYSKDQNSWVKEIDFLEKDVIEDYWDSLGLS
jgi:hypothetical protein